MPMQPNRTATDQALASPKEADPDVYPGATTMTSRKHGRDRTPNRATVAEHCHPHTGHYPVALSTTTIVTLVMN
jgi:hypothetical protein